MCDDTYDCWRSYWSVHSVSRPRPLHQFWPRHLVPSSASSSLVKMAVTWRLHQVWELRVWHPRVLLFWWPGKSAGDTGSKHLTPHTTQGARPKSKCKTLAHMEVPAACVQEGTRSMPLTLTQNLRRTTQAKVWAKVWTNDQPIGIIGCTTQVKAQAKAWAKA